MSCKDRTVGSVKKWREDYVWRTLTGAALSLCFTTAFALYNGYLGLRRFSVWHMSIGGFYLLITAIRGSILLTEKRSGTLPEQRRELYRKGSCLISSLLLTVLDLALMLPIALMVVLAKPLYIGLIPAIAMAAYTTWKITIASIHICRRRRFGEDLLLGELITVNFIDALVSILSLQNTLIMVNQAKTGDSGSMLTLSAVSSAVIYAAIIALTAQLLRKAVKGLRMS